MSMRIRAGFVLDPVRLALTQILPTKTFNGKIKETSRYKAIATSMREVGIIEPLIVYPKRGGKYMLLDGHARLEVLRDMQEEFVLCLVSHDDESYTYNTKVSRLAPIQANRMIVRALKQGVSEERLAKALNLNVVTLRQRRDLLQDICPEAIEILKDKSATETAIRCLKKVKPIRQIEIAELMVASGSYTRAYADFLVLKTPADQLINHGAKKKSTRAQSAEIERMQNEIGNLEKDFKLLDESYGRNTVDLTLARGYLKKLLDNPKVLRFLSNRYPELLPEFQKIVATVLLDG